MAVLVDTIEIEAKTRSPVLATGGLCASILQSDSATEVVEFLSRRPKHNFGMIGLIRDNGLESPLNRGRFYSCRDETGNLIGVSLIGHHLLFEVTSGAALECFADIVRRQCVNGHLVLGEEDTVRNFWSHYQKGGKEARLAWRELLMEMRAPGEPPVRVPGLRTARTEDIDLIVPVHAEMALEESGVNPLDVDPDGFRARSARRVQQGRVWVLVQDGRLVFKSEVVSDTPDLVYVEGVWVDPGVRGQGYLARCMSQIAGELLQGDRSMCILVNEKKTAAIRAYTRAGFQLLSYYAAIYL